LTTNSTIVASSPKTQKTRRCVVLCSAPDFCTHHNDINTKHNLPIGEVCERFHLFQGLLLYCSFDFCSLSFTMAQVAQHENPAMVQHEGQEGEAMEVSQSVNDGT
jgi:hypothetical protein